MRRFASGLGTRETGRGLGRILVATVAMLAVCALPKWWFAGHWQEWGFWMRAVALGADVAANLVLYYDPLPIAAFYALSAQSSNSGGFGGGLFVGSEACEHKLYAAVNAGDITQVQQLLESSDLGMDAIAVQTGLGSAASLRRHFQRRFAVSPSAWRRTFRGR
jgi:hypothetical protein